MLFVVQPILVCFITNLCELSRQLLNDVVRHQYFLIQCFITQYMRFIEDVVGMVWLGTHSIFDVSHLEVQELYFASSAAVFRWIRWFLMLFLT